MVKEKSEHIFTLKGPTRSADLVALPKTLIELYQPFIGAVGLSLYINLKCIWERESNKEPQCVLAELAKVMQVEEHALNEALLVLNEFGLVGSDEGQVCLKEPLAQAEFNALLTELNNNQAAAAQEVATQEKERDMTALFDFYQKQIGILGPVQEDKLRYWVCSKDMDVEVVVQAIGEMRKSTDSRRIEYLEGILRNWYNDGIRNLENLIRKRREWEVERQEKTDKRKRAPWKKAAQEKQGVSFLNNINAKVITPERAQMRSGIPNASAYKQVDSALVRRWKELFQDEHSS